MAGRGDAENAALEVTTNSPAMPMTDEELMRGAMARALAVRDQSLNEGAPVDLYVGLEGV